jgi:diacylglycerol O-acyltransferase
MTETLAPLDASFLLLERTWAPMHYGGLSILAPRPEGPITEADLRKAAGARLRRLPRLRQRPVLPWRGLRHVVWEPAPVDLERQVRGHRLPAPGDEPALCHLLGLLHASPLDHRLPLWELHLISGLADGRQAVLMKVHHAVADGIGGLDVAEALFDAGSGGRRAPRETRPAPVPGWLAALQAVQGTATFLAGGLGPPVPLFNRPVGPRRAFAYVDLGAAEIASAKHRTGGTLDDVLLDIVARGLARHLALSSNHLPERVRVMVPVSTRTLGGGPGGNQVGMEFIDLPLRLEPDAFVSQVAARKSRLRNEHEAPALAALVRLSGSLPAPLQGAAARLATGSPTFNLVVSDIPGPLRPYRLLGAQVEGMYPLMPLAPACGLSIAALSSAGRVGIGVTADPAQCPDVAGLAAELRAAAQAAARPPVRPRPAGSPGAARRARRSAPRCAPGSRADEASGSASARPLPR